MKHVWVVEDKEYCMVYLFSSKIKAEKFLLNELNEDLVLYKQIIL